MPPRGVTPIACNGNKLRLPDPDHLVAAYATGEILIWNTRTGPHLLGP